MINLEQLKEIANAGYHKSLFNRNKLKMYESENTFYLFDSDRMERYMSIAFDGRDYVNIEVFNIDNFNHLAAIRKMEELGLIYR